MRVTFDTTYGLTWIEYVISTASQPTDPVHTGDDFLYWYDSNDIAKAIYDFKTPVPSGGITFEAKWQAHVEGNKKVTFDDNNGIRWNEYVQNGAAIEKPDDPIKQGHTFLYWRLSGTTVAYDFSQAVTSNIIIEANYILDADMQNRIKITFDNGYGVIWNEYVVSKASQPTNPVHAGYAFEYWYDASNRRKQKYNFNTLVPLSGITLIAKWRSLEKVMPPKVGGGSGNSVSRGVYSPYNPLLLTSQTGYTQNAEGFIIDARSGKAVGHIMFGDRINDDNTYTDGNGYIHNPDGTTIDTYGNLHNLDGTYVDIYGNLHNTDGSIIGQNGAVINKPIEEAKHIQEALFEYDPINNNWHMFKEDKENANNKIYYKSTWVIAENNNNKNWYLVDNVGHVVTGWAKHEGEFYYLSKETDKFATLVTGTYMIDGVSYSFDVETGKLLGNNIPKEFTVVGAVNHKSGIDGQWRGKKFYVNAKDAYGNVIEVPVSGWYMVDGYYYYFDENNNMQTGLIISNDKYYYLKEDGKMLEGGEIKVDNKTYIFDKATGACRAIHDNDIKDNNNKDETKTTDDKILIKGNDGDTEM